MRIFKMLPDITHAISTSNCIRKKMCTPAPGKTSEDHGHIERAHNGAEEFQHWMVDPERMGTLALSQQLMCASQKL